MSWDDSAERMRARLHSRTMAYRAIFITQGTTAPHPWWKFWKRAKGGDLSPAAEIVLKDLARYCYAGRTTMTVSRVTQQSDALGMAFAEGRRDAFNRIAALANLTDAQLQRIVSRDE